MVKFHPMLLIGIFQEQKNRDIEKDKLLKEKEEGWKELRKPWKEIFNNPKTFIEEVRSFLGC